MCPVFVVTRTPHEPLVARLRSAGAEHGMIGPTDERGWTSADVETPEGGTPVTALPETVEDALALVTATTLVLGIDSDRLFPIDGQHRIARGIRHTIDGDRAVVLSSDFCHDGFLIETHAVGAHLRRLLES